MPIIGRRESRLELSLRVTELFYLNEDSYSEEFQTVTTSSTHLSLDSLCLTKFLPNSLPYVTQP